MSEQFSSFTNMNGTEEKLDLSSCEREPIHIPGRVQKFGCLIALTSDWIVRQASMNCEELLGVPVAELIGQPVSSLFLSEAVHSMRSRLQQLSPPDGCERLFNLQVMEGLSNFDVALHMTGRSIVLEFEPSAASPSDYVGYVRPMIERLNKSPDLESLCNLVVRQIKALTGIDRIMVYKFRPDNSGEVVAEAMETDMEPFLGLRYPASDIPAQARELYKRNLLRIISDIRDEGVEIIPTTGPEGDPLDLSISTLRAVSPVHLEYLANMGVAASMSISILRRGELWGLIACHHRKPLVLTYSMRTACELFAQLFAFVLDQKIGDQERALSARGQVLHDQIMTQLAEGTTVSESFEKIVETIASVVNFDGVIGWIDGQFKSQGVALSEEEFKAILPFLNTTAAGQVFSTDCLGERVEYAQSFSERVSGLLVLPVSRHPRDFIVLCRREVSQQVNWAGNPDKPVTVGPNGVRLTPRKSFEAWQQIVTGRSEEWQPSEIQAAETLRVTLLEVVLRMTDNAMQERMRFQEKQELLIAELNHRVRNILNLIKSLITQSAGSTNDISQFTSLIGGRINALGRAHDQITQKNWSAASLRTLINTEIGAYLNTQRERIVLEGEDVMLEPQAYSTLALVLHEMITNSTKYGALKSEGGRVEINWQTDSQTGLTLNWSEIGGPAVKAPARRGFGMTIIERSIPFELKGDADIRFDLSGVRASFRVPAHFISNGTAEDTDVEMDHETGELHFPYKDVLIVEDNMIIALDVEAIFQDLGAERITLTSKVSETLTHIDRSMPQFAILDVNLGNETSERIAEQLAANKVPFVFATGYGELDELSNRFSQAAFVTKPYDAISIKRTLKTVIGADRSV